MALGEKRRTGFANRCSYQVIQGPCANGEPAIITAAEVIRRHYAPYVQCTHCRKVLCRQCASKTGIVRGPNREECCLLYTSDAADE